MALEGPCLPHFFLPPPAGSRFSTRGSAPLFRIVHRLYNSRIDERPSPPAGPRERALRPRAFLPGRAARARVHRRRLDRARAPDGGRGPAIPRLPPFLPDPPPTPAGGG